MPYAWNYYAIDKYIDIEAHFTQLEELFNTSLSTYANVIEETDLDNNTVKKYSCFEFEYEVIGNGRSKFMLIGNDSLDVPMVLCYAGTDDKFRFLFMDWLKSELNCVIWKLQFDNSLMIAICDAVVSPHNLVKMNQSNIEYKFYNTLYSFDIKTTGNHLKQMEFEVSADSCRKLSKSSDRPYKNSILPYIYEKTGIIVDKIPLNSISLLNHLRITRYNIITFAFTMKDNITLSILKHIQPNN